MDEMYNKLDIEIKKNKKKIKKLNRNLFISNLVLLGVLYYIYEKNHEKTEIKEESNH